MGYGRIRSAHLGSVRTRGAMARAAAMAVGTIALPLILAAVPAPAAEWTRVAHWRMDEASGSSMVDAVGGHQGTTVDVRTGLPGAAGRAYGFDGKSSYVSVPPDSALNPDGRGIRLSLWLKATDKRRERNHDWDLVKKGYANDSPGLFKVEYQWTGRASCGFAGTKGSAQTVAGGPDLADARWHKVSCTKTATSIQLAVDGQPVATEEKKIGKIANADPLVIGAYRGPTHGGHFLGSLDEVTIEMADGSRRDDQKE